MKLPLLVVALAGLVSSAAAGDITLQANGVVATNSYGSGPFAGAPSGAPVIMTFDVFVPGTVVTPGQYVNYNIDPSSMAIDVNGGVAGMTNPNLNIGLQNDQPAADGLRLFWGANNLGNGMGLGFELGLTGTTFSSTDITAQAGTIRFVDLTSYSWEIHGGGGSLYVDFSSLVISSPAPGAPFCFGGGTGAVCPCGNQGAAGEGCANSTGTGGLLTTAGSNSVGQDDIAFDVVGLPANKSALLFAGDSDLSPGTPFGDGLRCAGGSLKRLGVLSSDGSGAASWPSGLSAAGGWTAGDRRFFQVWYRDPAGTCGSGFNISSAQDVTFAM